MGPCSIALVPSRRFVGCAIPLKTLTLIIWLAVYTALLTAAASEGDHQINSDHYPVTLDMVRNKRSNRLISWHRAMRPVMPNVTPKENLRLINGDHILLKSSGGPHSTSTTTGGGDSHHSSIATESIASLTLKERLHNLGVGVVISRRRCSSHQGLNPGDDGEADTPMQSKALKIWDVALGDTAETEEIFRIEPVFGNYPVKYDNALGLSISVAVLLITFFIVWM